MKLKQRALLSFCAVSGSLTVFTLFLTQSPWQPATYVEVQSSSAHLSILRKDLDASNFTQDNPSADDIGGLNGTELLRYIKRASDLNNPQSVRAIIRLAHALEEDDLANKEVLPRDISLPRNEKANTMAPGAMQVDSDRVLRGMNDAADIELDLKAVNELGAFVTEHRKKKKRKTKNNLGVYEGYDMAKLDPWQLFHNNINQFAMYDPELPYMREMLEDLSQQPIANMVQKNGGTQLKLTFFLVDNSRAIFKPMRFKRSQETLPDHFYFVDFERHTAEIAAFHLDKVLGFNRVPPVAGRIVNITDDIKYYAEDDFLKTFFISPAGNMCFHGKCDYYCDTGHAVCGHPDLLEGSLMAYLPSSNIVRRKSWRHPWRRSYHKRRRADWEKDDAYCDHIIATPPYDSGRRLLDLMDMSVFDFLQGNMDRHHYETFSDFGNFTFPIILDNGRGFGKANHDEHSILAPIYQCCLFRQSTLEKLLAFYQGPRTLSAAITESLQDDVLKDVLLKPHLIALDRRLKIILKTVSDCVQATDGRPDLVIKDDGF